jgi:hypothetical protein
LLQDTHNQQNDRVYSVSLRDIPQETLAVNLGAISKKGKVFLLYIEADAKSTKITTSYSVGLQKDFATFHKNKRVVRRQFA